MQQRNPITWRMPGDTLSRIDILAKASKRNRASLLHESVDKNLPALEKQYATEIAALKRKRKSEVQPAKGISE